MSLSAKVMQLRVTKYALAAVIPCLAACSEIVDPPTAVEPISTEARTVSVGELQTYDDILAAIGAGMPGGFGGLYFDSDGRIHLLIRDISKRESAVTALLSRQPRHPNGIATTRANVIVQEARYEFAELLQWYRRFLVAAIGVNLSLGDIDEHRNVIAIGVRAASDADRARRLLDSLRVPAGAVVISIVGDNEVDSDVVSHFRPAPGGVQITSRGPNLPCTLGFSVIHHQFGQALVTASHCTRHQGIVTNDSVGQHLWGEWLGPEVLDPAYSTSGCPSPYGCRRSDAALYRYDDQTHGDPYFGVGAAMQGWMANPAGFSSPGNIILALDPVTPYRSTYKWEWYCIWGYPCGEYVGMVAEKVGRTTGKTQGTVQATCVDFGYQTADGYFMIRCTVAANYYSDGGDSGAPVYVPGGWWGESDAVRVSGVHSGQNLATGRRFFARIADVENELGANASLECKGFKIASAWSWNC